MSFKFSEIEDAFFFVSMTPMFSNQAILCKETGKIFYESEYGDEYEIPEEVYYNDDCIKIPHKNDLDLGRDLVLEFFEQYLPGDLGRVRQIFKRNEAYGRYKDLLESRDFLQKWYDFENTRQKETLREWCEDNKISLIG